MVAQLANIGRLHQEQLEQTAVMRTHEVHRWTENMRKTFENNWHTEMYSWNTEGHKEILILSSKKKNF